MFNSILLCVFYFLHLMPTNKYGQYGVIYCKLNIDTGLIYVLESKL